MPRMNMSHFEVAILFAILTSIVLGVTTIKEGVWQAKIEREATSDDRWKYGLRVFGYFVLALFGIGWIMKLGHG